MIVPVLKDEAFLADVGAARRKPANLHIWWLGQSGFLVCWDGRTLLFDPYLSDSLTHKYEATDKPHVRMTERVVSPDRLDFVDVVTSTHNHTDHLDAETLLPIFKSSPIAKLVIPEANRAFVADRLKTDADWPVGLNDGACVEIAGFTFTGIPAAHNELERDDQGRCKYMGFIVGCGPWTLYHSGDTLVYPGLADLLAQRHIDIAFLPINGNLPERRVAGNMDGVEAARTAKAAGVGCVIPCHYEMFAFNTADPQEFVDETERIGQPYRVLRAGERFSVSQP